jgi:hypothetical protein
MEEEGEGGREGLEVMVEERGTEGEEVFGDRGDGEGAGVGG